jgi:hypothetical protein
MSGTKPKEANLVYAITVPHVPPSLNEQGWHWGKTHKLKRLWTKDLWILGGIIWGMKLRRLAEAKAKMRVSITLCSSREYDDDNKRYAEKIIYDALQQNGMIYRDSPEFVERKLYWKKCPHKERRTVVEIGPA